jgi:LuxR family transcriptional regulator, maltose regulon positive regulatory protein
VFSGDDHTVAAYLLSEVIDTLTPTLLNFLVRVSFVDLVSADLADALTGGSTGAATLAELARSNLFVQAVGPRGQWYRLHRLIADVLRARVSNPRTLRDIHRRAAEWYRRQAMPLDALKYALRGELWSLASDLAGVHIAAFALRGSARELDVLLSAVPRDVLLSHPELAAALAAARIMQGASADVPELMAVASNGANGLAPERAKRLRLVVDLMEMGHARFEGRLAAAAAAARRIPDDPRTLAGLGLAAWDAIPILVLSNAGTAELWLGDELEAEKHLRAAADANLCSGLLRPHLNAAAHLALLLAERGNLSSAQADAQQVVQRATQAGWSASVQVVAAYVALARVALDQDDPTGVDRWLARVAGVQSTVPEPHIQLVAAGLTALRVADAGNLEGARAGLRATTDRLAGIAPPVLADRLLLVQAELLRRAGDLARAAEVLAGLRRPATATAAHALTRLHIAAGELSAAERELYLFPPEQATPRERVEGAVLRVLIAAAQDRDAALRSLEDALLAAAPLGMRRPFLLESADLQPLLAERIEAGTGMAAFAVDLIQQMSRRGERPAPPAALVDALTEREHVVLRYLASPLSNAEIAEQLYLSVNTVKTHQRMIYRKLGADGRRDAVRRAKDLRLL